MSAPSRREMSGGLDHRIVAGGALDDAAVDVDVSAWKIMPVLGPETRSSRGSAKRDGDAFRVGRHAEEAELRARPIGDEDRLLARIRQRDRAGDIAGEQRRPVELGRKGDVRRRDGKRRIIAVECRRGVVAARDDAERKSADALRAAGIDAAERRLAVDPARQRPIGNRGRVVPQPAPAQREDDDGRHRHEKAPQPPAPRNGALALWPRCGSHHIERRFAGHCAVRPLKGGVIVPPLLSC